MYLLKETLCARQTESIFFWVKLICSFTADVQNPGGERGEINKLDLPAGTYFLKAEYFFCLGIPLGSKI